MLASFGEHAKIPDHLGPFLGVIFGLTLIAHIANRWLVPEAHPVRPAHRRPVERIGYVFIVRWDPPLAKQQAAWVGRGHGGLRR